MKMPLSLNPYVAGHDTGKDIMININKKSMIWRGPGIVRIGKETIRYGDQIQRKSVPSKSWNRWKKLGWLDISEKKRNNYE